MPEKYRPIENKPKNALFKMDDIIYCPTDINPNGPPVIWRVVKIRPNGDIIAVPKGGQKYPSTQYPRGPLSIVLAAQDGWKLAKM